jgi:hypothetical protein
LLLLTRSLPFLVAATLVLGVTGASAQTKLKETFSHVDFGINAVGEFSSNVSGPPTITSPVAGQIVTISPSNTVGALVTIRYTPKPYMGAEFNGGYSRYTENLNVQPLAIQTQVDEFTFGYLVTPPYTVFGVRPYASAGVGGLRFAPTRGGGEGAPPIGRLGLYYNVGVQKDIVPELFGIRAGFRELFYTAPDFYQNYLTLNKRQTTSEPMVGLYIRF